MVKNKKKFGAQTFGLIALSLMLVASLVLGMTGAWFTDKEEGTGDVTFGNVSLGTISVTKTYDDVLPGDTLASLGSIDYTGDVDAYYRITYKLTDNVESEDNLNDAPAVAYGIFNVADDKTITGDASLTASFAQYSIPGENLGNDYQGQTVTMTVTVDVIQARNMAAAVAATPTPAEYAAMAWESVEALQG